MKSRKDGSWYSGVGKLTVEFQIVVRVETDHM